MTGKLRKNDIGRWEIVSQDGDSFELTSGSCIEVRLKSRRREHDGGFCVEAAWIFTSIEHDGRDYYATTKGLALAEGLEARLP